MIKVIITVRNTHFTVKLLDPKIRHIISSMDNNLSTFTFMYNKVSKRMVKMKDKLYYVNDPIENVHRYHINTLKDFMGYLSMAFVSKDEIQLIMDKKYEVEPLELEKAEDYSAREYQQDYIDAVVTKSAYDTKLVDLITGGGKGLIGSFSLVELNMKSAIIVLPKYISKWKYDIQEYTNIDSDDFYIVQGSESLEELVTTGNNYKVVIFSITTLMNYIKAYLENRSTISVTPSKLMEHLKIGSILVDEVHQHFHAVYTIMMFMNAVRVIGLSATLDSNDKNMKRIYEVMFPSQARISNIIVHDPYLNVVYAKYRLQMSSRIQYKRQQGYNHHLYEQSILLNSVFLNNYIRMIEYYIEKYFITKRSQDEKCLIFAASVRLCTILTNHFKHKYRYLDVRRYVDDDPYENVIDGELTFSTVIGSGTAIDIPKLITVIQTISIGSLQSNVQAAGRLREIKGKEVYYVCLFTPDIPNQVVLHRIRVQVLKNKTKLNILEEYPNTIKTI